MAGSISTVSNTGVSTATQPPAKSGAERQVNREIGDLGKALAANDVAAAQSAVASLKNAAPTQNAGTDFKNAVKALDQALKSNNTQGAAEAFANLQQARKQIQQEQVRGPAQQVPNRPRVAGGVDPAAAGGAQTRSIQATQSAQTNQATQSAQQVQRAQPAQPQRATGAQTTQIARTEQREAQQAEVQKSFITRQDLTAQSAQARKPAEVGGNINTTA
jgi:hypothetical protein